MRLSDVLGVLDSLAPLRYASAWDNVGLLVGDPGARVARVLVTVDYTARVAAEAEGFDLVVAYHPPMFAAVKRVPHDAVWADAVRRGIALYSMHTALDVVAEGTNDVLADACEVHVAGRRPLRAVEHEDSVYKVVTFVPHEAVERVSAAMFAAGAGKIGGVYAQCSFRAEGTGTFFGEQGASPAVGQAGRLEKVPETRLETVTPAGRMEAVVGALRAAHPYEEPAFDLVRLAGQPSALGLGRVGDIDPVPLSVVVAKLKATLGLDAVLVADAGAKAISRVAVAAGAGGDLLDDAVRASATLFVTGEVRHHDALSALRRGTSVVALLHSNSERLAVHRFAERLARAAPAVEVVTSKHDTDPFSIC